MKRKRSEWEKSMKTLRMGEQTVGVELQTGQSLWDYMTSHLLVFAVGLLSDVLGLLQLHLLDLHLLLVLRGSVLYHLHSSDWTGHTAMSATPKTHSISTVI